jgi:cyclophilin family peptidyl-prolyl cis-trans isomerase
MTSADDSWKNAGKLVFLDIDISDSHASYRRAAEFVDATDLRYHFSSKDILELGGRELQSVAGYYDMDYDWSSKGPIILKPQPACRVIIKLFEDTSPLACENFKALCTGSKGKAKASGLPLHFKGVKFHRIVPNFIIQGGDIVMQNGTGGESIFGKKFKDERGGLLRKHDKAGVVSMCNSGKNSNTSQFFVTLRDGGCPQCDGKHVVFGEVR